MIVMKLKKIHYLLVILGGYKIIYIPKQKDFNKSKIKYITNSHKLSFDRLLFGNQLALQSNLGSSFICKK